MIFFFHQVNIGLALALLRGLTKDDVRTGAWEEKKVIKFSLFHVYNFHGCYHSRRRQIENQKGGGSKFAQCSIQYTFFIVHCHCFFVSQVKDLFLNLGESLVGKTCGFLGLGKIGLATARRWTSLDLLDLGLWTVVCSISIWG